MTFENRLKFLLEIDRICDEAHDESALALELVAALTEIAGADFGAFSLPDEFQPQTWKLQAVSDRGQVLERVSLNRLTALAVKAASNSSGQMEQETIKQEGGSFYVLAVPQRLDGESLGVILLASENENFDQEIKTLVELASNRMDSALSHLRTTQQLAQETLALRTILRVDRIRDSSTTLDELLHQSLAEVTNVIASEAGFIMLYDRQGNRLELRALTGRGFEDKDAVFKRLYQFADQAIQQTDVLLLQVEDDEVRAMLGVPLILNERIVGVLGVVNPQDRAGFTPYDRQLLAAIGSQMDTAIFERLQTQRLREVFGRNVGTKVMDRLLQISDRDLLEGERVELSVLFSDIRGFTRASAGIDPHMLEDVIDEHFGAMVEVVLRNEGTLDKFMGDGVMAFFNAPERQPKHPAKAVETAIEMQMTHQRVMVNWAKRGLEDLPIGIGVATGEVIVGNFASVAHAEYSAIGSTVNLAARLCEEAEGGQILISQNTRDFVNHVYSLEELPPKNLQGFRNPKPVWQVIMESVR